MLKRWPIYPRSHAESMRQSRGDLNPPAVNDSFVIHARRRCSKVRLSHPLPRPRLRILVVEDESKIADFVSAGLRARGYEVTCCTDGHHGFHEACHGHHDLIVLDIVLPSRDGLDILQSLRRADIQTPVILLTARNELGDRIEGLNRGADDYLAKPFFVEELAARIQALLRRTDSARPNTIQVGDLVLDRLTRQAYQRDRAIELTSREFALLDYLMRSAGQVFTRGQILEHVWGYDFDPTTNVVDVCIRRLRAKLSADDANAASPIEAVRGAGYRFRLPESPAD